MMASLRTTAYLPTSQARTRANCKAADSAQQTEPGPRPANQTPTDSRPINSNRRVWPPMRVHALAGLSRCRSQPAHHAPRQGRGGGEFAEKSQGTVPEG